MKTSNIKYVASIDQGTSSSRFMIFDSAGHIVTSHQLQHTQHYPAPGMVEHDPEEIWEAVKESIRVCMSRGNIKLNDISGIGITNQRETTVVWNKHTGKPYHRAIVWNDARTQDICDKLNSENHGKVAHLFTAKTGLPIATYFSGTKLVYLLENVAGLRDAALAGDAIFGTIDTWLLWKLTGGALHCTDVTNASRTLMMDIKEMQWDDKLLDILSIPRIMLPQIRSSSEIYGVVAAGGVLGGISEISGVPISGILGDQQAALFGQMCLSPGEIKVTYGTGAFLMMNTGTGAAAAISSQSGLLTTVAYQLGPKAPVHYALEGAVAYCGSVVQWLKDNLQLIENAKETEVLARSVPDSGDICLVPAFSGLFAPYWRSEARGVITGLTAFHRRAHIVRAALEAAALQVEDILKAMSADTNDLLLFDRHHLKVDGGMTKNEFLMQLQADVSDTRVMRSIVTEATALGAAFAAGLASGFFKNIEELKNIYKLDQTWAPAMDGQIRTRLLRNWKKAVARSVNWVECADGKGVAASYNDALIEQLLQVKTPNVVVHDTVPVPQSASPSVAYWTGVWHASAALLAISATISVAFTFSKTWFKRNST